MALQDLNTEVEEVQIPGIEWAWRSSCANDTVERLTKVCIEMDQTIGNTYFTKKKKESIHRFVK